MASHARLNDDAKRIIHSVYTWVTARGAAELVCTPELISEGPVNKTARICGVHRNTVSKILADGANLDKNAPVKKKMKSAKAGKLTKVTDPGIRIAARVQMHNFYIKKIIAGIVF